MDAWKHIRIERMYANKEKVYLKIKEHLLTLTILAQTKSVNKEFFFFSIVSFSHIKYHQVTGRVRFLRRIL